MHKAKGRAICPEAEDAALRTDQQIGTSSLSPPQEETGHLLTTRDGLLPVQNNRQLTLIVGKQLLTRQGEVLAVEPTSAPLLQMRSSRYPFSTGYTLPSFLALNDYSARMGCC